MGSFPEAYYDPLWGWFNYLRVFRLDFIHLENNSISFFSSGHHI